MDMAASAIMGAAFGAAGERCMALSVVVAVGDDTAEALHQRLNAQINAMRVGPGLVDGQENEMGPVISAPHRAKIADYIQSGVDQVRRCVSMAARYLFKGISKATLLGRRCSITSRQR